MEDREIVALYFARNERAISETQRKYGRTLYALSLSLLGDSGDAEECENDTYLTTWNKIPPERPMFLGAFLCKITRFLSMNLLRKKGAEKRPKNINEALEELEECIPAGSSVEQMAENKELQKAINDFLRSLSSDDRYIFVRRYFYSESIQTIAFGLSFSEGRVKTRLFRMREQLKKTLEKGGWM